MNRPISPVSFDVHRDEIDGVTPDPWGYSRLDRLDGLGTPLPAPVRPVAHRRATHVRRPIQWGEVVASAALIGSLVLMSCLIAAIALGMAGAL